VAEIDGVIVAMFVIRPDHPGPASHVANASYAVDVGARGIGIGRSIGEKSLLLAVHLWQSLGFDIVGTIPAGFRMPDGALVDHHIMHRNL